MKGQLPQPIICVSSSSGSVVCAYAANAFASSTSQPTILPVMSFPGTPKTPKPNTGGLLWLCTTAVFVPTFKFTTILNELDALAASQHWKPFLLIFHQLNRSLQWQPGAPRSPSYPKNLAMPPLILRSARFYSVDKDPSKWWSLVSWAVDAKAFRTGEARSVRLAPLLGTLAASWQYSLRMPTESRRQTSRIH